MHRLIQTSLVFLLSLVILFPLSLATSHWLIATLILVIAALIYLFKYYKSKKILLSFLASTIFGIFFSLAFWTLYHLHYKLHLRYTLTFIISFFVCFSIVCWVLLLIRKNKFRDILIALCNLFVVTGFVMLVIYSKSYETSFGHALLFGILIGFVVASITAYLFENLIASSSKIFGGLTDYIAILLKPFLIFFLGYLSLAIIYAGVYNLIYMSNPSSFFIPEGQDTLFDLIIYSLDTMTTGGNSDVQAKSVLAQAINTLNVFTAIIWMTVMLAATIAYTSESFSTISKKHKAKNGGDGEVVRDTLKPF